MDPNTEGPILQAYAGAMRKVAEQFPRDNDIQTMYAESLMNVNARKLWAKDGRPAPGTDAIVRTLEASPHPERAIAAIVPAVAMEDRPN